MAVCGEVGRRRLVVASQILAGAVSAALALSACGTPTPPSVSLPTRSVAAALPATATLDAATARDVRARATRTPSAAATIDDDRDLPGQGNAPSATPWRVSKDWITLRSLDAIANHYGVNIDCIGRSEPADELLHMATWIDLAVVARLVEVGPRRFRTASGQPPVVPGPRDPSSHTSRSTYLPLRFEVIEVIASRLAVPPAGVITAVDYEWDGVPLELAEGEVWIRAADLVPPAIRPEVLYERPLGVLAGTLSDTDDPLVSAFGTSWARALSTSGRRYTSVTMAAWWEYVGDAAIDSAPCARVPELPQGDLVDGIGDAFATVTPPTPAAVATGTPAGPGPVAR